MGSDFVLHGNIVHAPEPGKLEAMENGYLVVRDGKVAEITREPIRHGVIDHGSAMIVPGFCDMHVHASQYAMRGLGLDMELLPWLEEYTFPEEAKFSDPYYAKKIYKLFAKDIVSRGTTRACIYATIHTDSTIVLMDELEKAGVAAYVGKVSMDRNAPEGVCEDPKAAIEEEERWLGLCEERTGNVKPILTPRFIPSCGSGLLQALGELAKTRELPVQSHLSENQKEVEWVKELEPCAASYAAAYDQYGLFGRGVPTMMAHCVHISPEERGLMAENGVWMAHCPDSNANLASGMADVRGMLDAGVNVALGTDVAGGCSLSVLDEAADAIHVSKLREAYGGGKALTFAEAFYLATSAGAGFFGQKPGFSVGATLHAVVMDDVKMPSTHELSVAERLERMMYLHEDRNIVAVYGEGERIL